MKAVKEIVTIYNKPNATKVGYPIVNNGVASGFSAIDYFVMPSAFTFNNSFEMVWKVNTGNFNDRSILTGNYGNSYQNVFQIGIRTSLNFGLLASSNGSTTSFLDVTGTYAVLTNTDYWIRAGWTGTVYYLDYSLDGINYTRDITVNSTTKMYQSPNPFLIGYNAYDSSSTEIWVGSVDFSESYIKTDDSIWWQGVTEATEPVFKLVKNASSYYAIESI